MTRDGLPPVMPRDGLSLMMTGDRLLLMLDLRNAAGKLRLDNRWKLVDRSNICRISESNPACQALDGMT